MATINSINTQYPIQVAAGGTGLATITLHGIMLGNAAGNVTPTAEPSDGQLLIGKTGDFPQLATLTAGAGIGIANGAGTITISATGTVAWTEVTLATQTIAVNNAYIANRATLITFTLPAVAALGDEFEICGKGVGGWLIAQNALQTIHFGVADTTVGVGGSLASTQQRDSLRVVCTTANTDFTVLSAVGNITYV